MKKKIMILSILILGSVVMVRESLAEKANEVQKENRKYYSQSWRKKKQIILQILELPKQQIILKIRKWQRIRRRHQKLKIQEQHL